jgi:YfiH family protein
VIPLIRPDWDGPSNVQAFTTTRAGGVSQQPWDSFNLGARCGDAAASVQANRALLRSLLPSDPGWLQQVHGREVVQRESLAGEDQEADALTCSQAGLACAILTADCLPVVFSNLAGDRVGLAHAGWRGLAAGVLESTVQALDCDSDEVLAWLGPGIGPDAFEIGPEVREQFLRTYPAMGGAFERRGGRWFGDLYMIARHALARLGIQRVTGGGYCTYTDQQRFFSYRRDGQTGRMATAVWFD